MKCMIPGANVKVLARAIYALSRIGDELYVEPGPDKLSFRTVNSSLSAYASFTFGKPFFACYSCDIIEGTASSQDEDIKCKISMKSCLPIFRAPNILDRQVEMCLLQLDADGSRLVLEMRCRHGIIKTHYMPIIECETLQAVYTRETSANRLVAHVRVYADAAVNFQSAQEEITLVVSPHNMFLRSYMDDKLDPTKVIHTELCLEPGEFDLYTVNNDTAITFCLKEFRALLGFAESASLPIEVNFETAGRPAIFVVDNMPLYEVNFVLATLSAELETTPSTQQQQFPCRQPASKRQKTLPVPVQLSSGSLAGGYHASNTMPAEVNPSGTSSSGSKTQSLPRSLTPPVSQPMSQSLLKDITPSAVQPFHSTGVLAVPGALSCRISRGEQSPLFNSASWLQVRESDEEDSVPNTPPHHPNKKARFLFKRCFEATFDPSLIPGHNIVLAEDSAGEED